jgi:hypothetical protein
MSEGLIPCEAGGLSMLRRFGLALLAIASVAGGAQAQSVDVPKPNAIPLPPMSEPRWELGARYWWSDGKTGFNFTSSKVNPTLGNPTSKLTYDGMNGNSAEFVWRAKNESNTFAKGFVGGGWLNGGSLDDEDFFAGQIKFSDTYSKIKGDDLIYGTIDIGQDFTLLDRATKITFGPFVGFNFWQETATAYGARCNPDDVDGALCGPPGFIKVPFSTKGIQNEPNWASLRLGGELRVKLWDRLSLIGDAAVLPVASVWNYDSHYLRKSLGPVPNIEDRGSGWGYQLEAEARYDVTPCWALGAGVRYWFAEADGTTEFVHSHTKVELNDFTSERFGVFGDVTFRFATF